MAAIHGKGGDVTFAATDDVFGNITAWTFTSVGETADATGMGASWATNLDGLTSFTATVECVALTEIDIPADVGTEGTLILYIDAAGKNAQANAICTSATETTSVDDVGRLSFTFLGDATSVTYPV